MGIKALTSPHSPATALANSVIGRNEVIMEIFLDPSGGVVREPQETKKMDASEPLTFIEAHLVGEAKSNTIRKNKDLYESPKKQGDISCPGLV